MKSYRADYVYPINADPIKNGVVTIDDSGKIIEVGSELPQGQNLTEQLNGILCPGFVNTHSHLELAHLAGKVPPNCGLINFIKQVQKFRNVNTAEAIDAAYKADAEMYDNGVVAVGDISNTNLTIDIKLNSKIYYHTFVELFGFMPQSAEEIFERGLTLLKEFKPQSCSITPHAPYSVSKELFKLIKEYCEREKNLLSIHNQECEDENKLYRYKTGKFLELYESLGIDIEYFKPQARNSLQTVIPLLTNKQKILLVHNTFTNLKDIYFLKRFDRQVNWCFCPNANRYIEGRLPKIELFMDQGFNITLGTDSLASNTKLCILDEMRSLQQAVPSLTLGRLLQWGTLNGAKFLGIEDEKGTLEAGKKPGLNLITGLDELKLTPETKVRRLA